MLARTVSEVVPNIAFTVRVVTIVRTEHHEYVRRPRTSCAAAWSEDAISGSPVSAETVALWMAANLVSASASDFWDDVYGPIVDLYRHTSGDLLELSQTR